MGTEVDTESNVRFIMECDINEQASVTEHLIANTVASGIASTTHPATAISVGSDVDQNDLHLIVIIIGGVIVLLLVTILICVWSKTRSQRPPPVRTEMVNVVSNSIQNVQDRVHRDDASVSPPLPPESYAASVSANP